MSYPPPRVLFAEITDDDDDVYVPMIQSLSVFDARHVIALDEAGRAILWNVEIANRVKSVVVNSNARFVTRSADETRILVGSDDGGALMAYDVASGRQTSFFETHVAALTHYDDSQLTALRSDVTTQRVVTGDTHKFATFWCERTDRALVRWRATTAGSVTALACHDQHVATGGGDGYVRIWDVRRLPPASNDAQIRGAVATIDITTLRGPVGDLDFSNSNELLVSSVSSYVGVFNVMNACVTGLLGDATPRAITDVSDGARVLDDGTIPVDVASSRRLVRHARFRRDSSQIYCAIEDRWAFIDRDTNTLHLQRRATTSRYVSPITAMCETERGVVVAGDTEGRIMLWDVAR